MRQNRSVVILSHLFVGNSAIVPQLATETEERTFWEATGRDSADYLDWSNAKLVSFPNLKPSTQPISLRLPASLLESIKVEANKRDVPYQALIKVWLAEKIDEAHCGLPT